MVLICSDGCKSRFRKYKSLEVFSQIHVFTLRHDIQNMESGLISMHRVEDHLRKRPKLISHSEMALDQQSNGECIPSLHVRCRRVGCWSASPYRTIPLASSNVNPLPVSPDAHEFGAECWGRPSRPPPNSNCPTHFSICHYPEMRNVLLQGSSNIDSIMPYSKQERPISRRPINLKASKAIKVQSLSTKVIRLEFVLYSY